MSSSPHSTFRRNSVMSFVSIGPRQMTGRLADEHAHRDDASRALGPGRCRVLALGRFSSMPSMSGCSAVTSGVS
jgi:hypothetical protein